MVSIEDLRKAEAVVRRFFPATPLIGAPRLTEHLGTSVYLKLENVTPIRTFKIRGALVKLQSLVDAGVEGGVVTASAGNHGLAVAKAARLFGRSAVVCVPDGANPQKKALIAAEGAQVVEHGRDYQAAFENCVRIGEAEGRTLVHAYDDPFVIAGQGTVGLELADSGLEFDTVLMGIGGGGLISGVAAALKALKPGVRVIGVQPEGADSMIRSIKAGRIVELDRVATIADGLGARKPGEHTLAMTTRFVDEIRPVSDDDLWTAMRFLLHQERIVAEPAG
ncbi:MAG TPA: threonine/serine dehydratase, partial [Symbiobacteriaceae bacterium]|nr:threonine/serine dehydratase [Symbiobacteriaceae bacterium]